MPNSIKVERYLYIFFSVLSVANKVYKFLNKIFFKIPTFYQSVKVIK